MNTTPQQTNNNQTATFPRTPSAHKKARGKAKSKAKRAVKNQVSYVELLTEAITVEGVVNQAYRAFHGYSFLNRLLAARQLANMGLGCAPIASYGAWKDKGRQVKRGEKAICLFMPVTVKEKEEQVNGEPVKTDARSFFALRPNWFSLDQTEGADFVQEVITPAWDAEKALATLNIEQVKFESVCGNMLGYAKGRTIAINPLNPLKHKTRFHELAHIVLGHCDEMNMWDDETTQRSLMEVEAESVAYILISILDLDGKAESRAYIQAWLKSEELTENSAKKIFSAADKIMMAGQD